MRKGDTIHGYTILNDSVLAGGRGRVSFAKKDGKEFFIKVFLDPKYPGEGALGSAERKKNMIERCMAFETRHIQIGSELSEKCGPGGNLIYTVDFFRIGAFYYKVTEKVDVSSLKPGDIAEFPMEKIVLFLTTLAHSVGILHRSNIVHGDLKPDNILVKETDKGGFVAKLIDFDDSYFSKDPPDNPDDLVGTPEYYSPEVLEYIQCGDDVKRAKERRSLLTTKSDIFSMGIIFAEYLCGKKPDIDARFRVIAESVNDGNLVTVSDLSPGVCALLNSMLLKDVSTRPDITDVFNTLKSLRCSAHSSGSTEKDSIRSKPTIVIGKGLKIEPTLGLTSGRMADSDTKDDKPRIKIGRNLKTD